MTSTYKPFSLDSEEEIQRLEIALEAAGIGTWEYIYATNEIRFGERFKNSLGLEGTFVTYARLLEHISPDDRASVDHAFKEAVKPGSNGHFETEFRKLSDATDEVWLQWNGRAQFDEDGNLQRFSGAIQNISRVKSSERQLRQIVEQAPVATGLYVGRELVIQIANDLMIDSWGKDRSIIGMPLSEAVPELTGQPFLGILDEVFMSGTAQQYHSTPVQLAVNGTLRTLYFDFTYKPLFDSKGIVFAIMHMAVDVTERVLATKALESSEANLRAVIAAAPAAIGLFVGRDLIVQMPNQAFIDIVGKGPDISGKPLREVMPELSSQAFLQILDDVYTTGIMYQSFGVQVDIVQHGVMSHNFYNITYTPLFDSHGQVYAILDIAIDVTEKIREQQQIEKSQLELLSLLEESPVGIAILTAGDLTFTMANAFYGELVGRNPKEIIGKPLLEALPEIAGQGFVELLNDVVETGNPVIRKEAGVNIFRGGKLETIYIDLSYLPRKSHDLTIYGVLVVATDVTQQVLSRRIIEQAESDLRGAIELAELGTWELDTETSAFQCSERLQNWLGVGSQRFVHVEAFYEAIAEVQRNAVRDTITKALSEGVDAGFQTEFSLEKSGTRRDCILAMQGRVHLRQEGRMFVHGTIQDITAQRQQQASLEALVEERTHQLEEAAELMAAANEEMAATNEELIEANQQLVKSNDSLQQFSYVASHDLQEPLRKIQSFGDMLESKYGLDDQGAGFYISRMQASAKRMSYLINDLLSFSRVSYEGIRKIPVDLGKIIDLVISDLELLIQDNTATIERGTMPVIDGDESQLVQLFSNLINNGIKFRRKNVRPVIAISAQKIKANALPVNMRTTSDMVRIEVVDNGIGFNVEYAERIFQVFQRLHGRNEFEGTGIGLAICEKVVMNHGGSIRATSTPGQGSTFTIYLPA